FSLRDAQGNVMDDAAQLEVAVAMSLEASQGESLAVSHSEAANVKDDSQSREFVNEPADRRKPSPTTEAPPKRRRKPQTVDDEESNKSANRRKKKPASDDDYRPKNLRKPDRSDGDAQRPMLANLWNYNFVRTTTAQASHSPEFISDSDNDRPSAITGA